MLEGGACLPPVDQCGETYDSGTDEDVRGTNFAHLSEGNKLIEVLGRHEIQSVNRLWADSSQAVVHSWPLFASLTKASSVTTSTSDE